MLYLFFMDRGSFATVDLKFKFHSVQTLQEYIQHRFHLSISKQILLISGGQLLDSPQRVMQFDAADSESNPIYVFNKDCCLANYAPQPDTFVVQDDDIASTIDRLLELRVSQHAVYDRCRFMNDFRQLMEDMHAGVNTMMKEQHALVQGCCVAIANVHEVMTVLEGVMKTHQRNIGRITAQIPHWQACVQRLKAVEVLLRKIPMLPCLSNGTEQTLFDWIVTRCSHHKSKATAAAAGTSNWLEESVLCLQTLENVHVDQVRRTTLQLLHVGDDAQQQSQSGDEEDSDPASSREASPTTAAASSSSSPLRTGTLTHELQKTVRMELHVRRFVDQVCAMHEVIHKNQQQLGRPDTVVRQDVGMSILMDMCTNHVQMLKQCKILYQSVLALVDSANQSKCRLVQIIVQKQQWMSQYQVNLCSHVRTIKHLSHCVRVLDRLSHIVDQMECTPVLYARCLREIVCRRETFEAFAEWKLQSLPNVALVEMQQLQAELANHFLVLLFGSIVKGSTTERTAFHEFFDSNCNLPAVSRADLHDLLLRVPTLKEHLLLLPSERAFFESLAEELCVELPGDAPPTPAWTNDSFHSTREHLSTSQQGGVLPKVCCDASVSVESPGLLMSAEKLNILLQQTQTLHHWVQHSLPSLRQCQTQLKEEFSRTISIQIDQCRQFEDEIMKQLLHFSPAPERPLPPEMSHKAVNTPNSHLNAAHIQQLQQRKHNLQSTVESCRHDSDEAVASLRNQHHAVLTQLTQSLQENHQQALSELRHQLESQHDQDRKFLTENMQNTVQQKINDLQRTIDALMEQNMSLRQLVQEQQVDCTKEREYIGKLKSTTSQLSEKLPKTSAKQFAPVEALSRVIKFVHHDFKSGDLVAFTPVACSSGEQWRMLSSDGKVYFLLEECFAYLTHIIQAGGSTKSIQPVQQQLSQRPDLVKLAIFATKEKCQSKKDSNRYDVPSDSHFYRVIIHPRAIGSSSTS